MIGSLIGACLAYLINEINIIQKDLKILLTKVAVLESRIHNKRETD